MKIKVLESIIKKYYLSGLVDTVKWIGNDDSTRISFLSKNQNLMGDILAKSPMVDKLDKIGIFSTKKLLKILSIFSEDAKLSVHENKLNIKDKKFNVNFSLCDIDLIHNSPDVEEPPIYNQVVPLDKEFIDDFLSASKAIESDVFKISYDPFDKDIKFILGDVKNSYSDKIALSKETDSQYEFGKEFADMVFPLDEFREMLSSNRDATQATLSIFEDEGGMVKLYFDNEEYTSKYFLLANSD